MTSPFGAPLVLAAALVVTACGSSQLPVAPTTHHGDGEPFIIVPYPPPPARAEIVPLDPEPTTGAVWIDGEWEWKGRRWVWKGGRWEVPKASTAWAPATTVSLADGSLAHFPGTWRAVAAP
jgi:hypothetical protein